MNGGKVQYRQLVRRYFYTLGAGLLFLCLCLPVIFYFTDPLQLFRRSQFQNGDRLHGNMRVQAAGIINSFDFDSIILGTSMLENTSAKEASEKIGGHFFNLSLSGSKYSERAIVLNKALQKGIKNVVYSLDSYYFECNSYTPETWAFLYDDSRLNDFRIYFQKKFVLKFYYPLAQTSVRDMDRPNAWYEAVDHASRFDGLEKWVEHIDNGQVHDFLLKDLPQKASALKMPLSNVKLDDTRLQKAKDYIEKYLLAFVRQYPETTFYLIFPPYYRYRYADWLQHKPEDFLLHQAVTRYFAEQAKALPNMHVYGFEDEDFVDDIANYKDTGHYHYRFNSYFLDAIAAGQHEVSVDNVDAYLERCRQKAEAFDIAKLNAQAQELIRKAGKTASNPGR